MATVDQSSRSVDKLNQRIAQHAVSGKRSPADKVYRLGPGDLLEVSVFRADELNRSVRVDGNGEVMLPLLGAISVNGLSALQAEQLIADKLGVEYLQNPQVTVFVKEYRSQEIAVMGAVNKPDVYSVQRARSVFDLISLAGGLTRNAGKSVRIKTRQRNQETQLIDEMDILVNLDQLLSGEHSAGSLLLRGGDSVLVPEAGFVTVEGAVNKPGSYKLEGETNVLKALAFAGGLPWSAKQNDIKVIRSNRNDIEVIEVNLDKVRRDPAYDVILQDGDIVSVRHSVSKRAFSGFFKTAGQILGYRIN